MYKLDQILSNRTWLRRSWPFPHVTASSVFNTDFYARLAAQLGTLLAKGLSDTPSQERFARNIRGYDAYGLGFGRATEGPLNLFLSSPWRDMICNIFDIGRTPYVYAGAHYHLPGSNSGFLHNDFNPAWFPRTGEAAQIQLPNGNLCSYKTGEGRLDDGEKAQVVRGAAMLFYLLNDDLRPDDGGETALYASANDSIDKPAAKYRPFNNSLIAFECTPCSFHTFLSNRRIPRTSIVMWVHRTMDEAVARYGLERLERWKT